MNKALINTSCLLIIALITVVFSSCVKEELVAVDQSQTDKQSRGIVTQLSPRAHVAIALEALIKLEDQLLNNPKQSLPEFSTSEIKGLIDNLLIQEVDSRLFNCKDQISQVCKLNKAYVANYHLTDSLNFVRKKTLFFTLLDVLNSPMSERLNVLDKFFTEWKVFINNYGNLIERERKTGSNTRSSRSHKVTIKTSTGEVYTFNCFEDSNILDAAESEGISLPFSSRSGADESSMGLLISGTVDQQDQSYLDEEQIAAGWILIDVAYPTSDCCIDMACSIDQVITYPPTEGGYIIIIIIPGGNNNGYGNNNGGGSNGGLGSGGYNPNPQSPDILIMDFVLIIDDIECELGSSFTANLSLFTNIADFNYSTCNIEISSPVSNNYFKPLKYNVNVNSTTSIVAQTPGNYTLRGSIFTPDGTYTYSSPDNIKIVYPSRASIMEWRDVVDAIDDAWSKTLSNATESSCEEFGFVAYIDTRQENNPRVVISKRSSGPANYLSPAIITDLSYVDETYNEYYLGGRWCVFAFHTHPPFFNAQPSSNHFIRYARLTPVYDVSPNIPAAVKDYPGLWDPNRLSLDGSKGVYMHTNRDIGLNQTPEIWPYGPDRRLN